MAWKDYLPSFINFDKTKPKAASVTKYIEIPQQLRRVRADAQKFQIALQAAESPLYPNRYLLYQVYQQIVLDGQVQMEIDNNQARNKMHENQMKDINTIINNQNVN